MLFVALLACQSPSPAPAPASSASAATSGRASSVAEVRAAEPGSFAAELAFLRDHGDVRVLSGPHGALIAVSPTYQGRVMTSAVGSDQPSLGWINRAFIEAKKTGTAFDNYGGEDRFWLGPEGGQFGLYFPKGKTYTFANWKTPAAFQEGAWNATQTPGRVDQLILTREMRVENHAGTVFELRVKRVIRALSEDDVAKELGARPSPSVKLVAYETENTITNIGKTPWTRDAGVPSIWILGMYNPAPDAHVVVPFVGGDAGAESVVNDRYFGNVPADRLVVRDGYVLFTCDGKLRSKIGLGPKRAASRLASYSPSARLLTVVAFEPHAKPSDPYVNSMWEEQKLPYGGDVVNAYNDGPVEPGKPSLGGFYEIEASSPAAALAPSASITHVQRTMHFVGDAAALAPLAQAAVGGLERFAQ